MDINTITNWAISGSDAHKKSYPIYKGSLEQSFDLPNGETMTVTVELFKATVQIGGHDVEVVEKTYSGAFDSIKALRAEYREERGLTGTSARDRFQNRLAVISGKIESFQKVFDVPANVEADLERALDALANLERSAMNAFDAGSVDKAEKPGVTVAATGTE